MGGESKGNAWGRFSVAVLATVLVLGVTTGTIADYHEDKCSEEGGEQYGESDCSGVRYCPPNCNDDEYDSDENYICSDAERLTDGDLDGDGTDDCDDPDDDGDALSDKLERENPFYDYRDKHSEQDLDHDEIADGYDIAPSETRGALAVFEAFDYDVPSPDPECAESDPDNADPFIPDEELKIDYGLDDIILEEPPGWRLDDPGTDDDEDGHVEERSEDQVGDLILNDGSVTGKDGDVTNNVTNLPDNVTVFPGDTPNGIPRVTLTIGLMDHDVQWDDRMDLTSGGGNAAEFEHPLTVKKDRIVERQENGDGTGDCDSGIGFETHDSLHSIAVRAAVYHRDNPTDDIVETTDI